MNKKAISMLLFLMQFTVAAHAGVYVVKDAVITSVSNTNGNREEFTIWVSGGTGSCVDTTITFPASSAGSESVYQRAYAAALAAFASGARVWVHNYVDDSCAAASYIRLLK